MTGPSDTYGSPWPPHAICPCLDLEPRVILVALLHDLVPVFGGLLVLLRSALLETGAATRRSATSFVLLFLFLLVGGGLGLGRNGLL
jgi:hypothetical protein